MLDRLFEVGLTKSLVDHATLSTACHVRLHVGLFFHLKFLGPLCPQALVYNEVGWSWPFPPTKIVNFNGHGPSSTRLKWPGLNKALALMTGLDMFLFSKVWLKRIRLC